VELVKVDLLFKLAGIGILIMVFAAVLNQAEKKELAHLLTIAGVVVVLMFLVKLIGDLFNIVRSIFNFY
jgi:stage III sporulation protein AC